MDRKQGIERSTHEILKTAETSYLLPPDILKQLREKYPQVGEKMIRRAAVLFPSDPEKFIKKVFAKNKKA